MKSRAFEDQTSRLMFRRESHGDGRQYMNSFDSRGWGPFPANTLSAVLFRVLAASAGLLANIFTDFPRADRLKEFAYCALDFGLIRILNNK